MWLDTIMLTACICLSNGCSNSMVANMIEAVKEVTDEMLVEALELGYNDFVFSLVEQEEVTKEVLDDYKNDDLLSELYVEGVNAEMITSLESIDYSSDEDFIIEDTGKFISLIKEIDTLQEIEDLDLSNLSIQSYLDAATALNNFSSGHEVRTGGYTSDVVSSGDSSDDGGTNDGNYKYENDTSTGGKSSNNNTSTDSSNDDGTDYTLPILENDLNKATIQINGYIDDYYLIGIIASKEACIAVYNAFAAFFSTTLALAAGGKSTLGILRDELLPLLTTTITGKALSKYVMSKLSIITNFLNYVRQTFVMFLDLLGPVVKLIAVVLKVLAALVIIVVGAMILAGCVKKGFAVGVLFRGFLDWKLYFDILE